MLKIGDAWKWRFDRKTAESIEKELKRIRTLPNQGYFTLLHHEGPFIERSYNVTERIRYILNDKPCPEVLTRLKNIHYMTPERKAAVADIVRKYAPDGSAANLEPWVHPFQKDYKAIKECDRRVAKVLKPMLPFCSYNGKDIF